MDMVNEETGTRTYVRENLHKNKVMFTRVINNETYDKILKVRDLKELMKTRRSINKLLDREFILLSS